MTHTHDIMRSRLLARAGLAERPTPPFADIKSLEDLRRGQWSPRFEGLMRNRLAMGALRYGTFKDKEKNLYQARPWDLTTPIQNKVKLYEQTGNTEYLVDVANYCMLAFEFDPHPTKHFHALDDHNDHCKLKSVK